jgi:hypothetical protein
MRDERTEESFLQCVSMTLLVQIFFEEMVFNFKFKVKEISTKRLDLGLTITLEKIG